MTDSLTVAVTEALRASSAATEDCPGLFLRVQSGIRRRRRRRRSAATVAVLAVAAVVALPVSGLARYGGTGSAVSASRSADAEPRSCTDAGTLPSNAFLRRAETVDGLRCLTTDAATTTSPTWRHAARRPGLFQP